MSLLCYAESEDIYFSLCNRLERMVRTKLDNFTTASHSTKTREQECSAPPAAVPSVLDCATRLRRFLKKVEKERALTGECEHFVQHELQWADWFMEACRVGVLHLKVAGCKCRPEWEEPGSEDEEL
ncbi:hypothetical protein K458DRAFT_421731 [Lentithecium fluviatile CBS 122367]|uniref:Uncharacterized protein n=1 Tax=Lentithecium fluviatile CBS 122367 TaxID=1168545 RepID=A0A6G1IQC9_9PLEO|nr:hypothetical protein K458DRAFT_421731 [Lentithecium fluviatile CBS 122367]